MRVRRTAIVLTAVLALISACGGSDSSSGSNDPKNDKVADTGKPQQGGTLRIGLDAETDGWNPTASQWSGAGYQVAGAIFDPLVAGGDDGKAHPYLAESVEPNDDYTVWTITLRSGIKFHDGAPLDGDAVALQLNKAKASFLSGQLIKPVETVRASGKLTVEVTMNQPWVAFPAILATQIGYIASPNQLNASAEDAAKEPIGTGPYTFVEWQRDDHLTARKNPSYWREGKPYADEVNFKVIPEPETRVAALQSGEIDYTTTGEVTNILQFREDDSVRMIEHLPDRPNFIMLNTSKAPFDDLRVRRAMAYATDQEQLIEVLGRGLGEKAEGPYRKSSPWYTPSGYPTEPDLEKAKDLIEDYKADEDIEGDVEFTLGCTPVGNSKQAMDLLRAQWKKAGLVGSPKYTEQAVYINGAISGDFQANCWTQFGTPDPDLDATWWLSANANPPIALNFARHKDEVIDAALQEGRTNPDTAARKKAYGKVWKRFAERVPYVWTGRSPVGLLFGSRVRIEADYRLPDDAKPYDPKVSGSVPITSMWVTD